MKIADQKTLLNNIKTVLLNQQGQEIDKQWYFFKYVIQGEKNNCTITLEKPERNKDSYIWVFCRFENCCNASGYLNSKFNTFVHDIQDFYDHLDVIIDECYSDTEIKEQLVFDATGVRDVTLYNELYK